MAGSVNKVILIGNLGRDPEVRSFQNGGKVVNLRIATSETWRDRNSGERKERTEWHSVAIFSEPLAKIAEQYLRKGSTVYIEGQLETRKWQDQNGQDRYTTEVVLRPLPEGGYALNFDPAIVESFRRAASSDALDLWACFERMTCPTLLVRGASSDLLSRATASEMAARGPRPRVVEIAGVGHAPMFLDAQQIALARDFFRAG